MESHIRGLRAPKTRNKRKTYDAAEFEDAAPIEDPTPPPGRAADIFATAKARAKVATWPEVALFLLAIFSAFVSTWLTVKLALASAGDNGAFIAGLFGLLWESSKYVFASVGFFHPSKELALASRLATATLVLGSMVASLTFLGESVESYSEEKIKSSVDYMDAEYQREILRRTIDNKSSSATIDIDKGYRNRGLNTEGAVKADLAEYTALGKGQTELMESKTSASQFNASFTIAAFMLEVMGILALFLLRSISVGGAPCRE